MADISAQPGTLPGLLNTTGPPTIGISHPTDLSEAWQSAAGQGPRESLPYSCQEHSMLDTGDCVRGLGELLSCRLNF